MLKGIHRATYNMASHLKSHWCWSDLPADRTFDQLKTFLIFCVSRPTKDGSGLSNLNPISDKNGTTFLSQRSSNWCPQFLGVQWPLLDEKGVNMAMFQLFRDMLLSSNSKWANIFPWKVQISYALHSRYFLLLIQCWYKEIGKQMHIVFFFTLNMGSLLSEILMLKNK